MKTLLLQLSLLLCTAYGSTAQKIKFTDTSNQWVFIDTNGHQTYTYEDTVIYKSGHDYLLINGVLIRSDITGDKIYGAFLDRNHGDTAEVLLYDFEANKGDGWSYIQEAVYDNHPGKDTVSHYVDEVHTIMIDNTPHKVFFMKTRIENMYGVDYYDYYLIEGIGSMINFLLPMYGFRYYAIPQLPFPVYALDCFSNSTGRPSFGSNSIPRGPIYNGRFYNQCSYTNITETIATNEKVQVYPQPGNGAVTIAIPEHLKNAQLTVYNSVGVKVTEQTISGTEMELQLSKGLYVYRVITSRKDQKYIGKIIMQ